MYKRRVVPDGFAPPARADRPGFHLRMLTVHDVVKDFDAVMAAAPRLNGAVDQGGTWPSGLTLEENLIDLGSHQREFTIGHSFAYTVMNDDETRCLGCCYINPPDRNATVLGGPGSGWPDHNGPRFDAVAFYWARDLALEAALGQVFRALVAQFPFTNVGFPGRDQLWGSV